jgi:hypothetical protein
MQYDHELTEMAERATNRHLRVEHPDAIVTRGVLVVEFLDVGTEYRGVLALALGRQGPIQPYEILGLLAPVQIAASGSVVDQLWGHDHE